MKQYIFLALLLIIGFDVQSQTNKTFGHNTGISDTAFYRNLPVYNLSDPAKVPVDAVALTIGSKDTNLAELKNFNSLQYLFLDETFFLSSVNLKKQKTEALFSIVQNLNSLQFVSTYDPALLPYISKIKTLKGLCCNTFDNSIFNSLKTNFANLELLIVNDPAAERVDVNGLIYLKQLEIYSMYMSMIDESVFNLLSLKALRLKPGKVQSLSKNLSRLQNLSYFSMTGTTYFNDFPDAVFGLTNLQVLELDLRTVKKIPEGFANFKNLKTLILNEAQNITKLPEELSQLPLLENISLSDTDRLDDVSTLLKFDHSYTLILNRCNYIKIAKALSPFDLMNKMVISKSILKAELSKLSSLVPANKLFLADL